MKNYDELAIRTESPVTDELVSRVSNKDNVRLLHAVMGMETEVGELMDQLKKYIFYGKPLDFVNLQEELGDLEWYMAVMRDVLGVGQSDIQERNIAKLAKRYPEKYTHESALNRDLEAERKVLEGKEPSNILERAYEKVAEKGIEPLPANPEAVPYFDEMPDIPDKVEKMILKAMQMGWEITLTGDLINLRDISSHWIGNWTHFIMSDGRELYYPHWLHRRLVALNKIKSDVNPLNDKTPQEEQLEEKIEKKFSSKEMLDDLRETLKRKMSQIGPGGFEPKTETDKIVKRVMDEKRLASRHEPLSDEKFQELEDAIAGLDAPEKKFLEGKTAFDTYVEGVREGLKVAKNIASWMDGQPYTKANEEIQRQEERLLGSLAEKSEPVTRASECLTD